MITGHFSTLIVDQYSPSRCHHFHRKMIYQELFESVYYAEYIADNQYFVNDVTSEIVWYEK